MSTNIQTRSSQNNQITTSTATKLVRHLLKNQKINNKIQNATSQQISHTDKMEIKKIIKNRKLFNNIGNNDIPKNVRIPRNFNDSIYNAYIFVDNLYKLDERDRNDQIQQFTGERATCVCMIMRIFKGTMGKQDRKNAIKKKIKDYFEKCKPFSLSDCIN